MECRKPPQLVSASMGVRIIQMSAGAAHTAALFVDGALVMFGAAGAAGFGQLSLGDSDR
jgi:alpha-tubulin suppressor-like RCC1 family protein